MGKDYDRRPFSMPVVKHNLNAISGGSTGYMITRAPWQTGSNKYYVINKLLITNTTTAFASGALSLAIWDQDLSNTGPVARGSSLGPLLTVPIVSQISGGNTVGVTNQITVLAHDQLPGEYFQGGITVIGVAGGTATNISGVNVSMELQVT